MSGRNKRGICPCCGRDTNLTFHHFIPRKMHRRTHFKKHFSKARLMEGVDVCRQCHSGIHSLYDEMQLARQFSSLPQLLADDALASHFEWVRKQRIA